MPSGWGASLVVILSSMGLNGGHEKGAGRHGWLCSVNGQEREALLNEERKPKILCNTYLPYNHRGMIE